jgi:pyruvate/2-oxoglutarate dehydrogenase complex dihydrolipoamide acyltransferase (E2) component
MFADMGLVRRRRSVLGVAVVATSVAIAGCGGDKDDDAAPAAKSTPAPTVTTPAATTPAATTEAQAPAAEPVPVSGDPVGRAVAVLARQKGGLAVSMRGSISAQGVDSALTGTGRIDRRSHRGSFTVVTAIHDAKVSIRSVMDGHSVYLNSDAFNGRLPGGRSWMKIDLAKAARQKGFDLAALGTNGPSQDPSQVLDYLRGAGRAKKVGTETVRGVKTTRYRIIANLRRAKARSTTTASKLAIEQLVDSLGGKTKLPVDVWIDGRHRIVRERVRYTAELRGAENAMDFTTDFTGFGVAVKADPPPRRDTVDGLALLAKAQAAQQQSG